MTIMEGMMNFMVERMSKEDKESMMEKFFADITPEENQKMMADMMPKMMEGMNMADMMPKMMMGMMSGGGKDGESLGMQGMMADMMQGCGSQQMPEMMLGKMMPKCIELMLPKIAPEKRGAVAATVLSALVGKGAAGMTDEQRGDFFEALAGVLDKSK